MDEEPGAAVRTQEGLHPRARRRGGARRQGVGDDLGRQHRRHDGVGAAADGPDQGRQAPGHRHARSRCRARRRRCCSTPAPTPRCSRSGSCSSPRWASVYARHRFDIDEPRVGLLSIGEEPGKGDTLRKEAFELLAGAPGHQLHRQRRGPRRDERRRRRGRHRRLHRQRRAQDARGRDEGGHRRAARRVRRRALPRARRRAACRPCCRCTRRSTPTPTAAPCCSASTACASSPTARPARPPCATRIGVAHEMVAHGMVDEIRAVPLAALRPRRPSAGRPQRPAPARDADVATLDERSTECQPCRDWTIHADG